MPLDVLLNHVNEFTKIAVHIAAVFAGGWAIYTYKKSKRSDATKRIYDLYNSFYTNETISGQEILSNMSTLKLLRP